jgi:hypothetical protein
MPCGPAHSSAERTRPSAPPKGGGK